MQLAGLKKSALAKAQSIHVLNRSHIGNSSRDGVHTFQKSRISTSAMQLGGLKKSATAKAKSMHVLGRSRIGNSNRDGVHAF
jgi:hypothetical protein